MVRWCGAVCADQTCRFAARFQHNAAAYHTKFFNNDVTSHAEHAITNAANGGDGNDSSSSAPSRCCYGVGAQASNIFALMIGAVPEEHHNATASALVDAINSKASGGGGAGGGATSPSSPSTTAPHMDVGIFGTTHVVRHWFCVFVLSLLADGLLQQSKHTIALKNLRVARVAAALQVHFRRFGITW